MAETELYGPYRSGKVSLRFTAERGLEYLGSEADRFREANRRR